MVEFQIVRTTDPRAPFFWRMVDDAGHLLTYSSDRFPTVEACRAAIDVIKGDAGHATISVLD
jgi:hypothetical protein